MFRRSIYKSPDQLQSMQVAGTATAAGLAAARAALRVGGTPLELDAAAEAAIRQFGGAPNFSLEPGYRHTLCVSVNDAVVHGVPTERPFEPGDIVSVDGGAIVDGWNGDAAFTVVLPDDERPELVASRSAMRDVVEAALWAGIAALANARRMNAVGAAVEEAIGDQFAIVPDFIGHGVGRRMHESPEVFNYRVRRTGPAVRAGLVVAIEPVIVSGSVETVVGSDGWTVTTVDGGDAAHAEHTVAVHSDGIWVLTSRDGGAAGLAPFGVRPAPLR